MSVKNENVITSVTAILKSLECAICLELLRTPVSTGCGHFFCRFCITEVLKSNYRTPCPLCKRSFTRRSIQEAQQRQSVILAAKKLAEVCGKKAGINFFFKECSQKEVEDNCAEPCLSTTENEVIVPQKNYKSSTSKKRKSNENEIDGGIVEGKLPDSRISTEEVHSSSDVSSASKRCCISQKDEDSDDELPTLEELFQACKMGNVTNSTKKQVGTGNEGKYSSSKYEKGTAGISNEEEMDVTSEKILELAEDKVPMETALGKEPENVLRNRRKKSVNANGSKVRKISAKNGKNALRNKTNQLNISEGLKEKEAVVLSKSHVDREKTWKNSNESSELVKENEVTDVVMFLSPVKGTIKADHLSDTVTNLSSSKAKNTKRNTKKKLSKSSNSVGEFDGQTSSAEEESLVSKIEDAENFQLTVSRTTIPNSISVSSACNNEKECYSLSETELANDADCQNDGLEVTSIPAEPDNIVDTAVSVQSVSSPEKQKNDLSKSPGWSRVKQVGKDFRIRKFSKLHVAKNSSNNCSADAVAMDSDPMPCNMAVDQPVKQPIQNKTDGGSQEKNAILDNVERNQESITKTKEIIASEVHNSSPEGVSESSKMIVEAIVHSESSKSSDCKKSEMLLEKRDNASEDQADHNIANEQATKVSIAEESDNIIVNSCPSEVATVENADSSIPSMLFLSNAKPSSDFKTNDDGVVLGNFHTPVTASGSSTVVTSSEEVIQSAFTPKSFSKPQDALIQSYKNCNGHKLQNSDERYKKQSSLTKETDGDLNVHVSKIPQQITFDIGTNFENVNDEGIEFMNIDSYGANKKMPKILYRENIFDQEFQADEPCKNQPHIVFNSDCSNKPCYSNTVKEHIGFTDQNFDLVEDESEINQPIKKFKLGNASTAFPDLSKASKLPPKFSKISRCQITATKSILAPDENVYYTEHSQQTSQRLLNFCDMSKTRSTSVLPTHINSDMKLYSAVNLSSGLLKCHVMPQKDLCNRNQVEADNTENFINAEKTKVVKRNCLTLEEIQESFIKSNTFGKTETICSLPFSSGKFKLHVCVSEETLNISILQVLESDLAGVKQSRDVLLLSEKNIQTSCSNSPVLSPITVLPSSIAESESSQPGNCVSDSRRSDSENYFPYLNNICPSESTQQADDAQESPLNESEIIPFIKPGTYCSSEQNSSECADGKHPSCVTDEDPSMETSGNVSDFDNSHLPLTQPYRPVVIKENGFDPSVEKKVIPFEKGVKSDSQLLEKEISSNGKEIVDNNSHTSSNYAISSDGPIHTVSSEEKKLESSSSLPFEKNDNSSDILITKGNLMGGASFAQVIDDSEGFSSDPDMAFANDLVAPLKDITERMESSGKSSNKMFQKRESAGSSEFSDTTLRAKRSLQDFEELILKKSKDVSGVNVSSQRTSRLSLKSKRNSKKFKRIQNYDSDDSDTSSETSKNEACVASGSLRKEATDKSQGSLSFKKNDVPGDSVQATLNSFYSEDITNGNSSEIAMEIEDLDQKILSVVEKLKECGREDLLQRKAQTSPLNASSKKSKSKDENNSFDSEDSTDIFSQSVPPTPPGAY